MKTAAGVLGALFTAGMLAAQEPAPMPAPAPNPTPMPAQPPQPAQAPMAASVYWGPATQAPRRGWFGISLSCEECFIQKAPGRVAYVMPPQVLTVESGSPAWQAGMRSGDTIIMVDGQPITRPEGFERFATAQPGQPVRITLRNRGQEREVTVTPSASTSTSTTLDYYNSRLRQAQRNPYRAYANLFRTPLGWLGMAIDCENCSVTSIPRRGNMSFRTPPAVYSVDADGPAHRVGITRGDTLIAIDGVDLTETAGGRAFAQVEPGQRVTLTVRRGGRERRLTLTAVARPDATPQELQAFDEYKRLRDSSDAEYRSVLAASVARAQSEVTDLQRALRELELNRGSVDSSRRRIATLDSVLRALRTLERQRVNEGGYVLAPGAMMIPPTPPTVMAAPMVVATPTVSTRVYPLRYSGRLSTVANVEVRSIGAPVINEVGDSLIVVQVSGVEVKVKTRNR